MTSKRVSWRHAFASVLPEDVIRRKKSAYPNAQNPLYEKATREWALHILHDPNAPIHPLLDAQVVRALVESMDAGVPGRGLVSLPERFIQINEWLDTYQITLAL